MGGGGVPAACCTEKVCQAIVIAPVRAPLELAPAVKVTVPLPEPLVPAVIVIHGVDVVAVQLHPAAAETVTVLPVTPAAEIVAPPGLIENVHVGPGPGGGVVAAACVTVNTWPPMIR